MEMSRDNYEEFPELTPEAEKALREADRHLDLSKLGWHRRYLATFLREAVLQVFPGYRGLPSRSHSLLEMADNLYSPPPLPPTLAQARAADLDTPAGRDLVRDFLASVREVDQ
jgi:hypothetical protein